MNKINIGDRFGKLVVLEKTGTYDLSHKVLYRCKCDCGEELLANSSGLTNPKRPSCGKCTTRNGIDLDRKSTRLNSSHSRASRMPSSA